MFPSLAPREDDLSSKTSEKIVPSEKASSSTLSTTVATLSSLDNPQIPPDGGLQAWLQVLGSWTLFFNTFGLANTFGIYQKYYESGTFIVADSAAISWIGSLQAFLILLVGALTGPLFDAGHLRPLLTVGAVGIVAGHMMLSISSEYWHVILSQGVMVGLGAGCLHVPSLAILPGYFSRRLGLAVGIGAFGSSVGGVVYPIVFDQLVRRTTFGWSVRILGFIAATLLVIPILCMRTRQQPSQKRALIDYTACGDVKFILFTISCVVGFCGLYVPVFYLAYFGESSGTMSSRLASYLVPIFNASSVPGRLIPGYLADKVGPLNLMVPSSLLLGVLTFCLIASKTFPGIMTITILTGMFSGVYLSLPSVVVAKITQDKSRIGTRIGMLFCCVGLGVLAGGPGAGGILGQHPSDHKWSYAWIYSAACIILSGALLFYLRVRTVGYGLRQKI